MQGQVISYEMLLFLRNFMYQLTRFILMQQAFAFHSNLIHVKFISEMIISK